MSIFNVTDPTDFGWENWHGSEEKPSSMQLFFKQTPAQLCLCGSHLVASPYVWHFWGQIAVSSPSTSVKLRKFRCLTKAMLTPVSAPNLYHWATPWGERGKPSVLRWRWRRLLSISSTAALFPRASFHVLSRSSHQGEVMQAAASGSRLPGGNQPLLWLQLETWRAAATSGWENGEPYSRNNYHSPLPHSNDKLGSSRVSLYFLHLGFTSLLAKKSQMWRDRVSPGNCYRFCCPSEWYSLCYLWPSAKLGQAKSSS